MSKGVNYISELPGRKTMQKQFVSYKVNGIPKEEFEQNHKLKDLKNSDILELIFEDGSSQSFTVHKKEPESFDFSLTPLRTFN